MGMSSEFIPLDGAPGGWPATTRWRTVLETQTADRAMELLQSVYTPHALNIPRDKRVRFSYREFELGALHCGSVEYGCDVSFATTVPTDYLNLSMLCRGYAKTDDRVFSAGDAAAINIGDQPAMRLSADSRIVNLKIPASDLMKTCKMLYGHSWDGDTPRFKTWMDAQSPESRWLQSAVACLAQVPHTGHSSDVDLASRVSEGLLMQLVLTWPTDNHPYKSQDLATASIVKRAMDYIESSLDQAPRLEDLAQVTGVGIRTLHRAFSNHVGISPIRYALKRRLEKAHLMLTTSPCSLTVAEVATAAGFHNFGDFSASYRQHFGELPSAARKRRKPR